MNQTSKHSVACSVCCIIIVLLASCAGGADRRLVQDPTALSLYKTGADIAMLRIPAGTYVTNAGGEQRRVVIQQDFLLGQQEVSQALWSSLMDRANPSWIQGDALPVEWVTWEECQEFLRRLSLRDGRSYRLPTQDEWVYACYAGRDDALGDGNKHNYVHSRELTPVEECPINDWGLRGMNGNVWEWCADILTDGKHAMRGGSCNLYPHWCAINDVLIYPQHFKHERRGLRLATDLTDAERARPQQ